MGFDPLDLDAPGWANLLGGYRVAYDPRTALRRLADGDAAAAWQELWTELYHQSDAGEASYAAVPHLVRIHVARGEPDWNTYALAATIEEARRDPRNPELPAWLEPAYREAWRDLVRIGLAQLDAADDPTLVSSIIAVLAFAKEQPALGGIAVGFSEDERNGMLAAIRG